MKTIEDYLRENKVSLLEKQWVKINPKDANGNVLSDKSYYFYTLNGDVNNSKNIKTDINLLLKRLSNDATGTYKQTINKEVLDNLIKDLDKKVDYTNYVVSAVGSEDLDKMNKDNIITIRDRDLRKTAHEISPEIQNIIKDKIKDKNSYLIHHINLYEYDNSLDNIAICHNKESGKLGKALNDLAHALSHAQVLTKEGNDSNSFVTYITFLKLDKENPIEKEIEITINTKKK